MLIRQLVTSFRQERLSQYNGFHVTCQTDVCRTDISRPIVTILSCFNSLCYRIVRDTYRRCFTREMEIKHTRMVKISSPTRCPLTAWLAVFRISKYRYMCGRINIDNVECNRNAYAVDCYRTLCLHGEVLRQTFRALDLRCVRRWSADESEVEFTLTPFPIIQRAVRLSRMVAM